MPTTTTQQQDDTPHPREQTVSDGQSADAAADTANHQHLVAGGDADKDDNAHLMIETGDSGPVNPDAQKDPDDERPLGNIVVKEEEGKPKSASGDESARLSHQNDDNDDEEGAASTEDDSSFDQPGDDDDDHDDDDTMMAGGNNAEMPLLYYTRVQSTLLRPPPRTGPPASTGTMENKDGSTKSNSDAERRAAPNAAAAVTSLPFSVDCTCSAMGQIRWSPDMLAVEGGGGSSAAEVFFRTGQSDGAATAAGLVGGGGLTTTGSLPSDGVGGGLGAIMGVSGLGGLPVSTTTQQQPSSSSLLAADEPADETAPAAAAAAAKLDMEQPMPVVAMGLANGTVQVLDGRQMAGNAVVLSLSTSSSPSTALLQVREGTPTPRGSSFPPVVDVCFDATGTCLAALDRGGMCCIWEYKLEFVRRKPSHPQSASGALANATQATTPTSYTTTTSSVFTSFMSALTGSTTVAPTATTASTATSGTGTTPASAPTAGGLGFWRLSAVQAVRISYPSTFGGATVLALDPAYKRRREKAVLVGFADGRLILTKRGMLFQRRVDNVLYQEAATTTSTTVTTHNNSKTSQTKQEDTAVVVTGIQALTWRGSLVAWADATGVRLLDADQLVRIAHIDPPVGARPSLYAHQLVGMKPHLCFETSHKLLVAWGDCLLQLQLQLRKEQQAAHPLPAPAQSTASAAPQQQQPELDSSNNANSKNPSPPATGEPIQTTSSAAPPSHGPPPSSSGATSVVGGGSSTSHQPAVVRRRTVECTMAWQLDCVACGVAPLDADHVMVLGAVVVAPPLTESEQPPGQVGIPHNKNMNKSTTTINAIQNDMELQVISRANGQVIYADLLPLIRKPPPPPAAPPKRGGFSPPKTVPLPPPQPESIASFCLLSTFHLPRMDDSAEVQQEQQVGVPGTSFDFLYGAVDSGGVMPGSSLMGAAAGVPMSTSTFSQTKSSSIFRDPYLRWNLSMVSFDVPNDEGGHRGALDLPNSSEDHANDDNSIDSDVYDFVCHPVERQRSLGIVDSSNSSSSGAGTNNHSVPQAPILLIASESDAVVVRLRTVDDAVDYALEEHKPAVALQRAIIYSPGLRQFTIGDVVSEYYRALLRLPPPPLDANDNENDLAAAVAERQRVDGTSESRRLSLRRMKLAAYSMPVLLGGDVELWAKWIGALGEIPGSLFVVWNWIPVRDPVLPQDVYTNALCRMIEHVDHLRRRQDDDGVDLEKLVMEAENHFLQALLAWGSTLVLKEFLKLYKYQKNISARFSNLLSATDKNLRRRYQQSSANYLSFPITMEVDSAGDGAKNEPTAGNEFPNDLGTLFHVGTLRDFLHRHAEQSQESGKVVLEAHARLSMMQGDYDSALQYFLILGARHGPITLAEVESNALNTVVEYEKTKSRTPLDVPHSLIIALIENRNLHQCLLDSNFTKEKTGMPPLFALLQLVGLHAVGNFLMEHCVAPQESSKPLRKKSVLPDIYQKERSNSMPLDVVAAQLEGSPKILFWYLHALFTRKPEIYVNFPKTANLPTAITALYRKGLDLYIKYAEDKRDSAKALEGIETYRVTQVDTPLLAFLRVVLEVGGMTPAEVGKRLQIERKGGAEVSGIFALELAYIMENYGNDSGDESRLILDLYLKGAKSLVHAVSFAQRTKEHSSELWEVLIDYCLATRSPEKKQEHDASNVDGSLFGRLLEAAALSGANLAHLVSQIPPGMSIEGLRPRLVAAVADYRWKLQMHEGATQVASSEKIDLLREVTHRTRRGVRYFASDGIQTPLWAKAMLPARHQESAESNDVEETEEVVTILPPNLRPKIRTEHNWLSFSQPYR